MLAYRLAPPYLRTILDVETQTDHSTLLFALDPCGTDFSCKCKTCGLLCRIGASLIVSLLRDDTLLFLRPGQHVLLGVKIPCC